MSQTLKQVVLQEPLLNSNAVDVIKLLTTIKQDCKTEWEALPFLINFHPEFLRDFSLLIKVPLDSSAFKVKCDTIDIKSPKRVKFTIMGNILWDYEFFYDDTRNCWGASRESLSRSHAVAHNQFINPELPIYFITKKNH